MIEVLRVAGISANNSRNDSGRCLERKFIYYYHCSKVKKQREVRLKMKQKSGEKKSVHLYNDKNVTELNKGQVHIAE